MIAHRGGTDRFPELTLAAARHSLELGADCVELDIRFTRDGQPVISHDGDAQKLFGDPAAIADLTVQEFKALSFRDAPEYHPHTLEEVLAGGVAPILFHIKEGGERLAQILGRIRAHGYENRVTMGVLTCADVRAVKAFNKDIEVLAFMPAKQDAAAFVESGADVVRLWEDWVDEEAIRDIHAAGRRVWIMAGSSAKETTGYTSAENLRAWKAMGADGILINEVAGNRAIL